MKQVDIFTDGACSGNQQEENIGGWGCILEYKGVSKELCGGEINTTNNRMELTALIEALSALKEKGLSIRVFSDSSYLINCFREKWVDNWMKNGWKTSAKKPVENRELWEKLTELMDGQSLKFYLVKGHVSLKSEASFRSGLEKFIKHNGAVEESDFRYISERNARCDELANVFIKAQREQGGEETVNAE